MGKQKFSEASIDQLRKSPYVVKVSESSVQFSAEFKQIILSQVAEGKTHHQILRALGIDSKIFGKARLSSLFARIRKQATRPEGFERLKRPGRPKKVTFSSPEEENRYLRDRNAYLEQENEFLKKLKALEGGGIKSDQRTTEIRHHLGNGREAHQSVGHPGDVCAREGFALRLLRV